MIDPFEAASVRQLLDGYALTDLGAGTPRTSVYSKLKSLTIESLFGPGEIKDGSMAACCVSALWLWHNYLDESHKISQEIETSAGSAWHGIMHRREGDFWNANYWFARVRDAKLFPPSAVAKEFMSLAGEHRPKSIKFGKMVIAEDWSPREFTFEVERVLRDKHAAEIETALLLAASEWRVLFASCWRAAIG